MTSFTAVRCFARKLRLISFFSVCGLLLPGWSGFGCAGGCKYRSLILRCFNSRHTAVRWCESVYDLQFTGSNNLAPDFPIVDNVIFQNVTVTADGNAISVPAVGPGSVQPSALSFVESVQFPSATFSATVSDTDLNLSDGTILQLTSDVVTGTLVPSSGNGLAAGVDLVVLTVNGNISLASVPEPSSRSLSIAASMVMLGIAGLRLKLQAKS